MMDTMKNATFTSESSHSSAVGFGHEREQIHRNMLSAVAHDLKTPLASIIGSLDVYTAMQGRLTAEKQAELIKVALQEAHRLDHFITNILDMARLEEGVVKPKQERVNIGAMLANCLASMGAQLQGATVDIQGLPETVTSVSDTVLLSRAASIVLDNAIKYGGAPVASQVEYGNGDTGSGYIRIHDNGVGIASDQVENIFSKYTRLERIGQKKISGAGLGLAIARHIMQLLHGDIVAANHASGGAVFTLRFPLEVATSG